MNRTVKITTLRTISDCPDINTCPGIHTVADQPGRRYVILKRVTDPDEIAAFAPYMAADEILGWGPDELFPEV